jgi:hypothetical protein
LILLTEHQSKDNDIVNYGLTNLTEEDVAFLSEKVYSIAEELVYQEISTNHIEDLNIAVTIDVSKESKIDIDLDIYLQLVPRYSEKEDTIVEKVIKKTFEKVDQIIKENYTK